MAKRLVACRPTPPPSPLQNSVNIPPTLTKAQGSQVAIFAAQDFDFSAVYGLKAR